MMDCPGAAGLGVTVLVTDGGVGVKLMVAATLTLSIAMPSSEPGESVSVQRIQIELPGMSVRPVRVAAIPALQLPLFPIVGVLVVLEQLAGDGKLREGKLT